VTGPVPARVDAPVKDVLLGLVDHAVGVTAPTWPITVPASASTPCSRTRSPRSWRCSTPGASGTDPIGG